MAAAKTTRLRNTKTGVVIEVAEDKVERLALGWEPEKATTTRKSTSDKSTSDSK